MDMGWALFATHLALDPRLMKACCELLQGALTGEFDEFGALADVIKDSIEVQERYNFEINCIMVEHHLGGRGIRLRKKGSK